MEDSMRPIIAVLASSLVAATPATASPQASLPTSISIDGYWVSCQNTPIRLDPNLPDVGRAGPGLIIINPAAMQGMRTSYKVFIFAHECAHALNIMNESQADCFAARLGISQGWWTNDGLRNLVDHMGNSPGSYTHAPGPFRIQNIIECGRS
jgi:hypothetical protein